MRLIPTVGLHWPDRLRKAVRHTGLCCEHSYGAVMQSFEYLVVPAPAKGQKVKGLKTSAERYAYQLTTLLNELAAEGWEFWRADCLPSEERKGFTGTVQVQNNLLIFRRPSASHLAETLPGEATAGLRAQEPRSAAPVLAVPSSSRSFADSRREPVLRPATNTAETDTDRS